jgi:hypothetical protein
MRTTVDLDDDVAAAITRLRRERGVGLSRLVNDLVRKALATEEPPPAFRQRTEPLGLRIDVTNVAEALEILEGPEHG